MESYNRELDLARSDVVMLGVTPELAGLGASMTAVDESRDMIAESGRGTRSGARQYKAIGSICRCPREASTR
ncbi:hypothetical protein [Mesorhizobium sp. ORM8.1]